VLMNAAHSPPFLFYRVRVRGHRPSSGRRPPPADAQTSEIEPVGARNNLDLEK